MLIHLAVLACAAGLVLLVRRNDRYEKEPWPMMLLALGLGFVMMHLVGVVENEIFSRLRLPRGAFAPKAALVAAIEDCGKLLVVLLVAYAFRRQVNDPLDGVIYGTLIGLGAAIDESLLYLSLSPANVSTLGTELTRLMAHSLLGGMVGFAVGIGARPYGARIKRPLLVIAGLLVAVGLHFLWNTFAYRAADASALMRVTLMVVMLAMFLTWGKLATIARRRSHTLFGHPAN